MAEEKELSDVFYLAPLHGITVKMWRECMARHFRMPTLRVSPFIPTVAGGKVKAKLLEDVAPFEEGMIPQVIGKDPAELRVMLRALKELGYAKADLNAGCPWPMVAKKGRGAGLARTPEALSRMLEAGCAEMPEGFSVKLRLGWESHRSIVDLMPLLNEFPLREVCIHARTALQMYEGTVDLEAFGNAAALSRNAVVYNGDIFSRDDYLRLKARFPQISRWMIGRGFLKNPFLLEEILEGTKPDKARLGEFLADYAARCAEALPGEAPVLGRLKELWRYLSPDDRTWRSIRLCHTLDEYRRIEAMILR